MQRELFALALSSMFQYEHEVCENTVVKTVGCLNVVLSLSLVSRLDKIANCVLIITYQVMALSPLESTIVIILLNSCVTWLSLLY